jgi:hypothetical protein
VIIPCSRHLSGNVELGDSFCGPRFLRCLAQREPREDKDLTKGLKAIPRPGAAPIDAGHDTADLNTREIFEL